MTEHRIEDRPGQRVATEPAVPTVYRRLAGVLGRGVIAPDEPAVHADDLGLTRGDGCFEATRVLTDSTGCHSIDHLTEHLDRFDRSCAGLELPPVDRAGWLELIDQLLQVWKTPGETMLRLMLSRGRESRPDGPITGVATLTPSSPETLRQRREGIAVVTLSRGFTAGAFSDAGWLLGGVKTLSYAVNMAGTREAVRRGADDVLFTTADGHLLEAPTSTVVWQTGDLLHTTPPDGTGILASITQHVLFAAAEQAGLRTTHTLGTVRDLSAADGVWLVSSGRGVARVHTLNGSPLESAPELTERVRSLAGF